MLKGEFQLLRKQWYVKWLNYFVETDFDNLYEDLNDYDSDE